MFILHPDRSFKFNKEFYSLVSWLFFSSTWKWLKSWDWKFSCFLYDSGGWGTQNKGLSWEWRASEFPFWSFRALTERRYNWTGKLTVPALPLHPGHCFLYMKMDQIGSQFCEGQCRQRSCRLWHWVSTFYTASNENKWQNIFHTIQEITLIFKTECCVYIFFSVWKNRESVQYFKQVQGP